VECVSWRRDSALERLEIDEESVCRREEVDVVMLSSSVGERVPFSRALDEVEGVVRWCGLFLWLLLECVEMLRYEGRILCRYDRSDVMCVFYRDLKHLCQLNYAFELFLEEYVEDERCGTLL
jgi:hypothetical protein